MKMKKSLAMLLALVMTLSLTAPAWAAEEETPWYAEAQVYVTEKGLMTGTDKGFEPEATVTTATVFQILYNKEGKPAVEPILTDVEGKWYAAAATWAASVGFVDGAAFGEDAVILRSQIATVLADYAQLKGLTVTGGMAVREAPDYDKVPEADLSGVDFCYAAGLMTGDEKGNLNPAGEVTRAELATVLTRLDALKPVYTEETVAIEVPETDGIPAHTIPAIVTLPAGEGTYPAVVMLHGTGSDKHEAGGGYDLAAPAMAASGIASIRFDFMGNGESQADYVNYNYTSANIDAKAAADYMSKLDAVDGGKLAVMGWSQGGTNALLAAAKYPDTFQAVITWSGAVKLSDAALFGDKTFDQAYSAAKKDGYFEMTFDWREPLHLGEQWFKEVKATDVLKEAAKLKAPVLAINGDLDTTVLPENAAAIAEAAPNGRALLVEGADHTYNVFTEAESGYAAIASAVNAGIGFLQETLNGAVTGAVNAVSKYGNVGTDIPLAAFAGAGYEVGDILTITIGETTVDAPYGTGYSNVDTGKVIIVPDTSTNTVAAAINMGNFSTTYSAEAGAPISFSMKEKEGYLEEYEIRNIDVLRSNDRADYDSDEVFANFRSVVMGDIAEGVLYRASSPVNPELGRNTYSDALIEKAGVKTVVNLADSEEEMKGYEGWADTYYAKLDVAALDMGVDFADPDFSAKLKTGLEFMLEHEGPYLIHCTEGKDRAGFTIALLEALMGGKLEEIKADYMLSYVNYYHVEKDSDRYNKIAESNILASLRMIAGLEEGADLSKTDLRKAAADYLTGTVGLTAEQVTALESALATPIPAEKAA